MVLKADQQRVKALLTETVTLLCKNGLHFKSELSIEGLIGITLDQEEIFLVNIKEVVRLNKPPSDVENTRSPAPIEHALTAKKGRPRTVCAETGSQPQTSVDPVSISVKSSTSAAPKEPPDASNLDNSSALAHRSCSPPGLSAKSHSDASLLSSSSKPSETAVSERPISFCDVPIKLDYALGSQNVPEDESQPDEELPSEPARKRRRSFSQNPSAENRNSMEPPVREMPSRSCKQEPSDVIEIKEESLSDDGGGDDDMAANSMAEYSAYAEYSSMAGYSASDLDASQMYGESSNFQGDGMFQDDMQASLGSHAHEHETSVTERHPVYRRTRGRRGQARSAKQETITCSECPATFKSAYSLRDHVRYVHRGLYRFFCKFCGKGTKTMGDLRGHMACKHDQPRDFKCQICQQEFGYKCHYKEHMQVVHGHVK